MTPDFVGRLLHEVPFGGGTSLGQGCPAALQAPRCFDHSLAGRLVLSSFYKPKVDERLAKAVGMELRVGMPCAARRVGVFVRFAIWDRRMPDT